LYPVLLSGIPFNSEQLAVSSLTEYEIGNVLWKEGKKKKLKDPEQIAEVFEEVMGDLRKIYIDSIANVLAIALERDLTFYDASYSHIAEKEGLKLITENAHLLKKCECAIASKEAKDILT
jgi:predicted nucleic acid-binding protein